MVTAPRTSEQLRAELAAKLEAVSFPRSVHDFLGRFAAHATAPMPRSPALWFIDDVAEMELESKDEAREILRLLFDIYNDVVDSLAAGREVTPPPEDADAIRDWCAGYFEAALTDEVWMSQEDAGDQLHEIAGLAGEKNDAGETAPEHLRQKWRPQLAEIVADLYRYWAPARDAMADHIEERTEPFRREEPKVGRNAPCPCGSGKKYKRCCGVGGRAE